MKTRILLLAGMLAATMTMQAQTVEYTTESGNGTLTITEGGDFRGQLANATSITLKGSWYRTHIAGLNDALMNSDFENEKLTTAVFDESAVIVDMTGCFKECKRLNSVTLPKAANNYPVSFDKAFSYCMALTTVDLSSFTNIQTMNSTFDGCQRLATVKMPAMASNGVSFTATFQGCFSLTEIDLSAFTALADLSGTFTDCQNLTSVKLPATYEGFGRVSFDSTFEGCSKLTSVDLRAFTSVSTYHATFRNCSGMEAIYLGTAELVAPDNFPDGYEGTFTGCPSTCKVYLPEGVTVAEIIENWRVNATVIFVPYGSAGIEAIGETDAIPAITNVYSIDGRLLKTVPAEAYADRLNGLQRGIYLVNGKKEAVR